MNMIADLLPTQLKLNRESIHRTTDVLCCVVLYKQLGYTPQHLSGNVLMLIMYRSCINHVLLARDSIVNITDT